MRMLCVCKIYMMIYYQERYDYDKLYANFKYNYGVFLYRTRIVRALTSYTNIGRYAGCLNTHTSIVLEIVLRNLIPIIENKIIDNMYI